MIEYWDATDDPETRVSYPELVDEFIGLGFEMVGRYRGTPVDQTDEETARSMGAVGELYLEHGTLPTPVLRPPDRSAFAEVSWFLETPAIRIFTVLDDGSLVETLRAYRAPADTSPELRRHWRGVDVDWAIRAHNPAGGRSIVAVEPGPIADLWSRHQQHVAAYGSDREAAPIAHTNLDDFLRIVGAAMANRLDGVAAGRRFANLDGYRAMSQLLAFAAATLALIAILVVASVVDNTTPLDGWWLNAAIAVAALAATWVILFTKRHAQRGNTVTVNTTVPFDLNRRPTDDR